MSLHIIPAETCRDYTKSSRREWMLSLGNGGYAMGTVSGANARRYHGLLVAATQPPEVRTVLLAAVEAYAQIGDDQAPLSTNQYAGTVHPHGYKRLREFRLGAMAEWEFEIGGQTLIKRLVPHPGEDTVTLSYHNPGPEPCVLTLRPLVCHKFYHENFRVTDFYPETLMFPDGQTVLTHNGIELTLSHPAADRTPTTGWYYRFHNEREAERGLEPTDDLFCPCELRYLVPPGESAVLVASTHGAVEPRLTPALEAPGDPVVEAARRFAVKTPSRTSLIAGYPWFTDWGRDTMIGLPGACLLTGEMEEAKAILRAYASQMRHGLIPNRFVDKGSEPEYNTVDATLWFAQAVYATLHQRWDEAFATEARGWLRESIEWHLKGTLYGIKVDSSDGLLSQGAPGVQLTWMDAKVGEWVVTPRHGKPVEINGLWVNALRVTEWIEQKLNRTADDLAALAEQAAASMQSKFWHQMTGHYLDTVDPSDASLRPNQVIAMALPFSPLTGSHAAQALAKVRQQLLTPYGLRTLGPQEPGYRGRFEGDMRQRDAAYHQGTVWPWLIGPYVEATLRVTGDVAHARDCLSTLLRSLDEYGLGGIAEVYDGDAPHVPGGCPWQLWSAAELLRARTLVDAAEIL